MGSSTAITWHSCSLLSLISAASFRYYSNMYSEISLKKTQLQLHVNLPITRVHKRKGRGGGSLYLDPSPKRKGRLNFCKSTKFQQHDLIGYLGEFKQHDLIGYFGEFQQHDLIGWLFWGV